MDKATKAKKKSKLKMWGKMLFILVIMGTISCNDSDGADEVVSEVRRNVTAAKMTAAKMTAAKMTAAKMTPADGQQRWRHKKHRQRMAQSDIRYLRRHLNKRILDFVLYDTLHDGEVEKRIHYKGVTAKETFVGTNGSGILLRQLSDGRHLVQVIYSLGGDIQDCEYVTQEKSARTFLKTLRKELKTVLDEAKSRESESANANDKFVGQFRNVTLKMLKGGESLPPDVAVWFNYDDLKMECLVRHEEMKRILENPNKVTDTTISRSRRSLRENVMLPGTKWCGVGQLATTYNELGADRDEDKCCRAHDLCRLNIGAFKRRFGMFNIRPYTISHCRCDRRFRACLKLADTSVSNMVGKLFFNIVQTKCFVLKPMKVCTQRSWWGKCLKRSYTKQAFLRDNLPY